MTDPNAQTGPEPRAKNRTLKDEVLGELAAWSAECSGIAREISRVPGDTGEEAAGHETRAERVDDITARLKTAVLAERSHRLTQTPVDVYADDLTDHPSEPAYRYEASCNLPFDSTAVGGIVGYSDESAADAAAELKIILTDLGLDPADVRLLDGCSEAGEELPPADS